MTVDIMGNMVHAPLIPLSMLQDAGVLVDCGAPESFDAAHTPGSINLPFAPCDDVSSAVSWLAGLDARVAVTGETEWEAADMAVCLDRFGIDCLGVLEG